MNEEVIPTADDISDPEIHSCCQCDTIATMFVMGDTVVFGKLTNSPPANTVFYCPDHWSQKYLQ